MGWLIFHWKYPFCVNFVQKLRIFSLGWNLVLRLIQICRNLWWCSIPFLGKFGPKNQNCQFELKFSTLTNFNIQNSIVAGLHFFCFRPEKPFLGKFGQENQNSQFKLKFGTKTNSNEQNSFVQGEVFYKD